MAYFLRIGGDYLEDAVEYRTKTEAINAYKNTARELAKFGQGLEASIHIGDSRDEVVEYPDFVLSLGPRGGVRVERA